MNQGSRNTASSKRSTFIEAPVSDGKLPCSLPGVVQVLGLFFRTECTSKETGEVKILPCVYVTQSSSPAVPVGCIAYYEKDEAGATYMDILVSKPTIEFIREVIHEVAVKGYDPLKDKHS